MTRRILYEFIFFTFSVMVLLSACAPKDDTTNPVIFLKPIEKPNGVKEYNPINIDSIGGSFIDPGYTAVDDNDGDISNKVVVQYPVIGKDSAKSYQVFYSVMDNVGNNFTTYRVVNIRNTAAFIQGIYNTDSLTHPPDTVVYQSTITSSSVVNGDFSISNFAGKGQQAVINGRLSTSNNLLFDTPVNLLDSDSTVINNVSSAFIIPVTNKQPQIEINFYLKNDTIPDSTLCKIRMIR